MSDIIKAKEVRDFINNNPDVAAAEVVEHLAKKSIEITASYVRNIKSKIKKSKEESQTTELTTSKVISKRTTKKSKNNSAKYPRHSLERCLRIPKGIMEQNAGKECTEKQSATFVGLSYNKGPYTSEISSCIKFGLLERPRTGYLALTQLGKQILRPQNSDDEINGLRHAVLNAPDISSVYEHYRGENLPEEQFFSNTLVETFKIPLENISDFKTIFHDTLLFAKLLVEHDGKYRIIDSTSTQSPTRTSEDRLKDIGKNVKLSPEDSCFVMMPFSEPLGQYYTQIYKPAIEKTGLKPIRADDDIFSTGKIIDQVWSGINNAKVLVAELTSRNANVYYELGLAHALNKPVVLVSSNEDDMPFDLKHIRVIYYDKNDPFWGNKLIDKVAENILSAINTRIPMKLCLSQH